jgi:hypothetical protein
MKPLRLLPLALAAAAAIACGSDDGVRPEPGAKAQVSIDFCPSFAPTWLAIQNEGEAWQSVSINPSGPTVVEVTPKVSVATVTTLFGSTFTQIVNITREEMSTSGIGACEAFAVGSRELAGSVAGLTGEQVARISVAAQTTTAGAQTPTWALSELPAGPIDLVATRYASPFSQPANRVIVRRNVMPGVGASVSPLDFGGSESHALESATVTVAGASGDFVTVQNSFVTANGTAHLLMDANSSAAAAFGYVSVPAALRTSTDIHLLDVWASSADGLREILHSYRAPTNKTLTLGPIVSVPSISAVASSPYLRLTAQVASQPEYSTAMAVDYLQAINQQSVKVVAVMTTAAYLGGRPASWALTIPDLTSVGYQASWGLQAGSYDWSVTGFEGNAALLLGGPAADGATLVSAMRLSPGPVSTVQARISAAARSFFWRAAAR